MAENEEWGKLSAEELIGMTLYGDRDGRRKARDELRRRIESEQETARR